MLKYKNARIKSAGGPEHEVLLVGIFNTFKYA